MLNQAKINCEYGNWYPMFKSIVPKARVLEAPESFREYLISDGIALCEDNSQSSDSDWETPSVSSIEKDNNDSGETTGTITRPPIEFHEIIESTIKELNGEVAPKLNWSAPIDSKWMSASNTMRCTSANEIYLLLKSSDYVNHDLMMQPSKITLVMREWFDLHPSTEFRCFVKDRQLVAITQRDMNYYDFLEHSRPYIKKVCTDLSDNISSKFPDPDYVFDTHIPKKGSKAYLIDINPWDQQTDTLLYSWDELNTSESSLGSEKPELRLVEKVDRTRTFSSKPHSTSHVPYDFIDMDRNSLEDMLIQVKTQRAKEKKL